MDKIAADIIKVDGRFYYLIVPGSEYWRVTLLKKNLKRDSRSLGTSSLSAEKVARGTIVKRGVSQSELF